MAWTIRLWVALSLAALISVACGDDDRGLDGPSDAGDGGDGDAHSTGGEGNHDAGRDVAVDGSVRCGDSACLAPAFCDETEDPPMCACPTGYEARGDDASRCVDIDECAEGTDNCPEDATCKNSPGGFECACDGPGRSRSGEECTCAEGFTEVDGECLLDNAELCAFNAECASGHCVSGVCCEVSCESPGPCQLIEGTVCQNGQTCRYAKELDGIPCDDNDACSVASLCFDGECVVDQAKNCRDTDHCTVDSCDSETGECQRTPLDCDDNNPCTTDSCDSDIGCQYTDNDAATCSDDDPCTNDACRGGICVSTQMDCSEADGECKEGICSEGACRAVSANEGGPCTSGLGACDTSGVCESGACVGSGEACGPLASSCAPCSDELGCHEGRLCACAEPLLLIDGTCVDPNDECLDSPCDPLAECSDPTPGGSVDGDVECVCPTGYGGDGFLAGEGCSDIDECANAEPCGVGVRSDGCDGTAPPGSYSCACSEGFVRVSTESGPKCVCDLSGTYALLTFSTLSWGEIGIGGAPVIEPTPREGVPAFGWSLRYNTVDEDGTMKAQTIPCGASTPDLCDTVFLVAHAQYQPTQVWGKAKLNAGIPEMTIDLAGVEPGGTYDEPEIASLMGIVLDDPAGPWPPCRQCVGVDVGDTCRCPDSKEYTVENRATWYDADGDRRLGVTSVDVGRGGTRIDGTFPDPPVNYSEPSECPRLMEPTGVYNYSEWPGGVGLLFFRSYQWHGGTRLISRAHGDDIMLDPASRQCRVSGAFLGPQGGRPRTDARVQGCETCSPAAPEACVPDDACDEAEVDSYDAFEQSQALESIEFTLEPLPDIDLGTVLAMPDGPDKESALNQVCAEVRVAFCPPGENCSPP